MAIDCDDIEVETPFWRMLEQALDRDVDLRPRIGPIAWAVEEGGELCYDEQFLVLERNIQRELEAIADLYEALAFRT